MVVYFQLYWKEKVKIKGYINLVLLHIFRERNVNGGKERNFI